MPSSFSGRQRLLALPRWSPPAPPARTGTPSPGSREELPARAGDRRGCRLPDAARSRASSSATAFSAAFAGRRGPPVRGARPMWPTTRATSGLCRWRRMNRRLMSSTSSSGGRRSPSGRAGGSARRRTPPCRCAGSLSEDQRLGVGREQPGQLVVLGARVREVVRLVDHDGVPALLLQVRPVPRRLQRVDRDDDL